MLVRKTEVKNNLPLQFNPIRYLANLFFLKKSNDSKQATQNHGSRIIDNYNQNFSKQQHITKLPKAYEISL